MFVRENVVFERLFLRVWPPMMHCLSVCEVPRSCRLLPYARDATHGRWRYYCTDVLREMSRLKAQAAATGWPESGAAGMCPWHGPYGATSLNFLLTTTNIASLRYIATL